MTTTYLAGYDGGAASRAAVQLAVLLGESGGADVVAAYVYRPPVWADGLSFDYEDVEADLRREAGIMIESLRVPGVRREVVRSDSPARGLHELAAATGAELIAVGSTHHGRFGRLAPGSVGMHLLHGAPCPVLVVPRDTDSRPPRTIGVAYDGRPESRAALHEAEVLTGQLDAQLLLLGVVPPLVVPVGVGPAVPPAAAYETQQAFDATLERVALESGPRTEHRTMTGSPGRALSEASADVDLLVTGSRGYGPLGGVLLGSVSRYLVDHAPCPVLVVPRTVRTRALGKWATVPSLVSPSEPPLESSGDKRRRSPSMPAARTGGGVRGKRPGGTDPNH